MDAAQWLAGYRDRLEHAADGARRASESLRDTGASVRSPRGEVTVSVNAAGALTGLTLTPAARKLECDALAALILATTGQAQRLATQRMTEVMADYLGDGAALAQLTQHAPTEVPR
ncbi:YbaB/EbfC family nucleoid-associated protein [Saccharomonospora piscinae]|uniref:YbaB/EbfC family nucleoid-associated protein n=1 Tax=Saccharomonospora piscinae TaxID=687388 RepID=UPI000464F255|nr:YbaB/EbfC family nucleoid-associated protein [Saccharomonospora piscinae]